jgi:hypothetical protein
MFNDHLYNLIRYKLNKYSQPIYKQPALEYVQKKLEMIEIGTRCLYISLK